MISLDIIIEIITCFIDAGIGVWFISKFNEVKINTIKSSIFFAVYSSFNIINLYFVYFSPYVSVINTFLLLVFSFIMNNGNIIKKLVAPFVFEGTLVLVNSIILVFFAVITRRSFLSITTATGILRISIIISAKIIFLFFLALILRIISKSVTFKFQDYFLLIIFPITLFLQLAFMVKIALSFSIVNMNGDFAIALLFLLLTYIGIYYLVYKIAKNNQARSERELYEQMLRYEEKRYSDMGDRLEQLKKIKHDIKNQLLAVKMRIEEEDCKAAAEELNKIMNNVSKKGSIIQTNNDVVDYILNTKFANVNDCKIIVSGSIAQLKAVQDIDLSIILGNIIDNALEGVQGIPNAQIELSFSQKDHYQNIVCKNTILKSVLQYNPELKTTKQNPKNHGYGMKSVYEVVEHYYGNVSITEEESSFVVHVMLPITLSLE